MKKETIQLELSIEEINLVLNSLGKLPFEQVFQIIGKIQQQANGQLTPENGKQPAAVLQN